MNDLKLCKKLDKNRLYDKQQVRSNFGHNSPNNQIIGFLNSQVSPR